MLVLAYGGVRLLSPTQNVNIRRQFLHKYLHTVKNYLIVTFVLLTVPSTALFFRLQIVSTRHCWNQLQITTNNLTHLNAGDAHGGAAACGKRTVSSCVDFVLENLVAGQYVSAVNSFHKKMAQLAANKMGRVWRLCSWRSVGRVAQIRDLRLAQVFCEQDYIMDGTQNVIEVVGHMHDKLLSYR
jgi:hypothetical protein